jgi:hypothetical protein
MGFDDAFLSRWFQTSPRVCPGLNRIDFPRGLFLNEHF